MLGALSGADRRGHIVSNRRTIGLFPGAPTSELATQATFSAPGVYWLCAIASDGMLETSYDVKVTVSR